MANTKKKAKKKQHHPLKKFVSVFTIMIAGFLTYVSAQEVFTTFQLHQDIAKTQTELDDLAEKQTKLEDLKVKFEDPEYVKQYARGKYLLSKDGETIFKYPDKVESNASTTE